MPYDPSGNYSLPPSYLATPGQTIRTEQHNPPLEDIQQALSFVLVRDGRNGMVGSLPMGGNKITGLAPGTADTDAATVAQAKSALPVGAILDYAGNSAPAGWLFCFGQEVSRATYADLFAAIGTAYGPGNGSTTFNLPDLRGRVAVGRDNMGGASANRVTSGGSGINGNAIGSAGGAQTHTLTVNQIPSHNHGGTTGAAGSHNHNVTLQSRGVSGGDVPDAPAWNVKTLNNYGERAVATSGVGNHTHTIPAQGGGQAHNNMQPSLILNKIIKATY